jgi:NAD(P)-dependent dehydrogenase (short-subunit alcohol dehydrogenase family)
LANANSLFSLEGRVAIVTGALGLLGREHCKALAEAGAIVVVTDLDQTRCEEFANELGGTGFGVDITSKSALEKMREALIAKYGNIDILINNAAINDMFENPTAAKEQSKFENYPLELWQRSLDVNVTGTFLASQYSVRSWPRRVKEAS